MIIEIRGLTLSSIYSKDLKKKGKKKREIVLKRVGFDFRVWEIYGERKGQSSGLLLKISHHFCSCSSNVLVSAMHKLLDIVVTCYDLQGFDQLIVLELRKIPTKYVEKLSK